MKAAKKRTLSIEEQATGCIDANSYREYALKHGYAHVAVLDWTSSAGDWQFIVSKDGHEWRILHQENNWPRAGFSHTIGSETFYGSEAEVLQQIVDMYY